MVSVHLGWFTYWRKAGEGCFKITVFITFYRNVLPRGSLPKIHFVLIQFLRPALPPAQCLVVTPSLPHVPCWVMETLLVTVQQCSSISKAEALLCGEFDLIWGFCQSVSYVHVVYHTWLLYYWLFFMTECTSWLYLYVQEGLNIKDLMQELFWVYLRIFAMPHCYCLLQGFKVNPRKIDSTDNLHLQQNVKSNFI